jgi:hypothetical protein
VEIRYGTNALQSICAVMFCPHLCSYQRGVVGILGLRSLPHRT